MKKHLLLMALIAFFAAISFPSFARAADEHAEPTPALPTSDEDILDLLWKRSDAAFHAGDYPRAIRLHQAIVEIDPHDVESYSNAAWLMWSLGNGDAAERHIEQGLQANPQNWEMWDAAGQQHDLQKYFSKAQEAYQKAVELIPSDADSQMLRRRLAHAAEKAGDLKTAEKTWQKLVKDYPTEAVNKNNLERVRQKIAPSRRVTQILSWPLHLLCFS